MTAGAVTAAERLDDAVIWHDVECAAYEADLELWRSLAEQAGGGALEVGCGSGRVALDLAARGHDVSGLDADPALVAALAARARHGGLRVPVHIADARSFQLGRSFGLVIAPMQVVQLLGGAEGRAAALSAVRAHLSPGGRFAAALADPYEGLPPDGALPPLPDVREEAGWTFSSTPVTARVEDGGGVLIERLRQAISPAGELAEAASSLTLDLVGPGELERAAASLGYRALGRRAIAPTESYVGSTVVVLEAC